MSSKNPSRAARPNPPVRRREHPGTHRFLPMLEDLAEVLPLGRAALLRREPKLLLRFAGRCFPEREDQVLADISDVQGLGGPPRRRRQARRSETRAGETKRNLKTPA